MTGQMSRLVKVRHKKNNSDIPYMYNKLESRARELIVGVACWIHAYSGTVICGIGPESE